MASAAEVGSVADVEIHGIFSGSTHILSTTYFPPSLPSDAHLKFAEVLVNDIESMFVGEHWALYDVHPARVYITGYGDTRLEVRRRLRALSDQLNITFTIEAEDETSAHIIALDLRTALSNWMLAAELEASAIIFSDVEIILLDGPHVRELNTEPLGRTEIGLELGPPDTLDANSSADTRENNGTLIGLAVGAACMVFLAAASAFYYIRQKKQVISPSNGALQVPAPTKDDLRDLGASLSKDPLMEDAESEKEDDDPLMAPEEPSLMCREYAAFLPLAEGGMMRRVGRPATFFGLLQATGASGF
eukprot:gene6989-8335_t